MALSDDQRAMLQLLLERGQTYDDLASVLGTDRAEVRKRARAALTDLAASDPDSDVALSDYLLGQADPIARADVVRHLQNNADSHALASELSAKLRLVAPDAELPDLPAAKGRRRAAPVAAATDGDSEPAGSVTSVSSSQSRLMVGIGAAAVLLVVIVLAIAGVFSDDESGSDAPQEAGIDATTPEGGAATEEGTRVVLQATDGSDAKGLVQLGFTGNDQGVVAGVLEGLPEPDKDHVYLLWFLNEDERGFFLLQPIVVEKNGRGLLQAPVSAELLPLIQNAQFIDVASLDESQLKEAVNSFRTALDNSEDSIAYVGDSVMRGDIPRTDSGS